MVMEGLKIEGQEMITGQQTSLQEDLQGIISNIKYAFYLLLSLIFFPPKLRPRSRSHSPNPRAQQHSHHMRKGEYNNDLRRNQR